MRILCQPSNSLFLSYKFKPALNFDGEKVKTIRKSGQLQNNRGAQKPRTGRQGGLSDIPDTVWRIGQSHVIGRKNAGRIRPTTRFVLLIINL